MFRCTVCGRFGTVGKCCGESTREPVWQLTNERRYSILDVNNKYERNVIGRNGNVARIDVYDILNAYDVRCPALQHLIKKALCPGSRGHKDIASDLKDIISSANRALELYVDVRAKELEMMQGNHGNELD